MEYYDGLDNNLDSAIDENTAVDASVFYRDEDGDGYGSLLYVIQCQSPGSSYVLISGDCRDDHPDIFPMAIEIPADNIDQNCDQFELCYEDVDGDEYGSSVTISTEDITCSGDGISLQSGDCDDNTTQISPNQSEICDSMDNDCNNAIDDNSLRMALPILEDLDGDGYGNPEVSSFCARP